ncbi:MAG: hypothetical protein JO145_07735 [Acidobacteriaceae bacterium]|nr:hypothetical protein [Acidobacteriaceae bacterium]MBV9767210.1 hypothetical protein [Acidobacteriaceae bacterium]
MEALLGRFRTLTVLLIVIVAQLLYLAYQVKTNRDERLIRVWAVTAVTPMAGIVEAIRQNTIGFMRDYFILLDVRDQNRRLLAENKELRMDNIYFRNQLLTAEHARALVLFQAQSPSKTIAARVIGNSTVATAKAVFIDRGSTSGIEKGMAVVTPEGVIGKVVSVYPLVSQVLLVTDPTFKVGVESQKGHIHGLLDCGRGKCVVEQIQNEEKVDPGERFFTSGEDRIFPRGFPVGTVVSVQPGQGMKDVKLELSGTPGAAEEVLVVLQGVHQSIPVAPVVDETTAKMLPPPPPEADGKTAPAAKPQTEADKVLQKYDTLGKEEGHVYGAIGSTVPNFNAKPAAESKPPAQAAESEPAPATKPPVPTLTAPAPQPSVNTGPALPLGAPRRKPPPPAEPKTPAAEQPPPQ